MKEIECKGKKEKKDRERELDGAEFVVWDGWQVGVRREPSISPGLDGITRQRNHLTISHIKPTGKRQYRLTLALDIVWGLHLNKQFRNIWIINKHKIIHKF